MSPAVFQHIRGVQPSSKTKKQKTLSSAPPLTTIQKNIQKISQCRKKQSVNNDLSSTQSNNIMDQKCFRFFMDYCVNAYTQTRIPINTQECSNFLAKHNVEFINERTQELSNSKVFITTKMRKRNNATFVIQLPQDYNEMLLFLVLLKIDFSTTQIELSPIVGRTFKTFLFKAKRTGFKYYYDFIRLNILNQRFIIVRS